MHASRGQPNAQRPETDDQSESFALLTSARLPYVSFAMFKLKTRVYTCSDKSILCILNRVFRNCFCYVRPSTKHVYAHQLPPLHLENLLPPANSIATSPSSLKACQLYQFFPTHTFSSLIRGTKKIQRCLLPRQQ